MADAAASEPVRVTPHQLGVEQGEAFEGRLDFDLGNLMACDPSPQDAQGLANDREAHCLETATQIAQSLAAQLFQLPGRLAGRGRVVSLPAPAFPLPRQKPLPTPRPPTRWEKFAQQKGIQKRKRGVKVWDEAAQEWRRRFGYQRAGDERDVPVVEAGPDDVVGEDPFTKMQQAKAQRVKSTERRQLANTKHALKSAGRGAVPSTLKLAATLPEHGKGQPAKRRELAQDIKAASRQAGVATASMGKFDKHIAGEKPEDRQMKRKRQKFEPAFAGIGNEKAQAASAVDRLLRERADDIIDMEKAVTNVRRKVQKEADVEQDRQKGRKKQGKPAARQKGGKKGSKGGKVAKNVGKTFKRPAFKGKRK